MSRSGYIDDIDSAEDQRRMNLWRGTLDIVLRGSGKRPTQYVFVERPET